MPREKKKSKEEEKKVEEKPKRRSTLSDPLDLYNTLDFDEFTKPYQELAVDYGRNLYTVKRKVHGDAYMVTFTDDPSLFFISFASYKERDKVRYAAIKYFHQAHHPDFITRDQTNGKYKYARRHRCPDLDRYADEKRVPIWEVMKLGVPVPCAMCLKHQFTYEQYLAKKCFVIEEGVKANIYTKGVVLCYDCYKKLVEE
jgi:hypothetical protein